MRKSNIFQSKLLALMGIIYHTWRVRNEVIFNATAPDVACCSKAVIEDCKLRLVLKLKLSGRRGLAMRKRFNL